MTYEEKLNIMKKEGTIKESLLVTQDYFRFIRDGMFRTIKDNFGLYEVHCKPSGPDDITDRHAVYCYANEITDRQVLNNFLDELIKYKVGYMELEQKIYFIELDILESYE